MPESLTRKKRRQPTARVAGFKSEWWPDLFRNGGRLQIGTPAGFTSEHPAGLNRNPQVFKLGQRTIPATGPETSVGTDRESHDPYMLCNRDPMIRFKS
jgi:hypothetical protein